MSRNAIETGLRIAGAAGITAVGAAALENTINPPAQVEQAQVSTVLGIGIPRLYDVAEAADPTCRVFLKATVARDQFNDGSKFAVYRVSGIPNNVGKLPLDPSKASTTNFVARTNTSGNSVDIAYHSEDPSGVQKTPDHTGTIPCGQQGNINFYKTDSKNPTPEVPGGELARLRQQVAQLTRERDAALVEVTRLRLLGGYPLWALIAAGLGGVVVGGLVGRLSRRGEVDALAAEVATRTTERDNARNETNLAVNEAFDRGEQLTESERRLDMTLAELNGTRNERDLMADEAINAREQLDMTLDQLAMARDSEDQALDERETARDERDDAASEAVIAQGQRDNTQNERDLMANEVIDRDEELLESERRLDMTLAELDFVRTQRNDLAAEAFDLQTQRDGATAEAVARTAEKDALQAQIDTLRLEIANLRAYLAAHPRVSAAIRDIVNRIHI